MCVVLAESLALLAIDEWVYERRPTLPLSEPLRELMRQGSQVVAFAIALLLSWRLNRCYERWWAVRTGFAAPGAAAVAVCQSVASWLPERDDVVAEMGRWFTVWHYTVLQVITGAEALHPEARARAR